MRYLTALIILAACGGDDGAAMPYSNAHSEMCGSAPSGQWDVGVVGTPDILAGVTLCVSNPYPVWDFDGPQVDSTRQLGDGCEVLSMGAGGSLDVTWIAPNEYDGTIYVYGPAAHGSCTFSAHVKLTPHQ
jgi:hypothetical protein